MQENMSFEERQLSIELIGDVESIDETVVFSERFRKQDIHIEAWDHPDYKQILTVQAVNDKCDNLFQEISVGDKVKLKCNLRGRRVDRNDGNPPKYFNSIEAWGLEKMESAPGGIKDDIPF